MVVSYCVGVDPHKKFHQVQIQDGYAHTVWEGPVPRTSLGQARLIRHLERYGKPQVHVGVEGSGPFWVRLVKALAAAGIPVSLVNPKRVKHWARSGAGSTRTDRVDAGIIADYIRVRRPRLFTVPPPEAERLMDLLKVRHPFMRTRAAWKNRLGSYRERDAAPEGLKEGDLFIQEADAHVDLLTAQIKAQVKGDPVGRALLQIKGVGPITAAWFLATFPRPEDYPTKAQVKARVGLVPQEHHSAGKKRSTYLSREGPPLGRVILHMAACVGSRHNPELKAVYEARQAHGDGKKKARVYVMIRLLVRMWQIAKRVRREERQHQGPPPGEGEERKAA